MTVSVLTGDCREVLRSLPSESVHCVVTSPPYWGLRDYGVAGQLGLEPSLAEHVETMRSVFAKVRRVLRRDGTLWLNYGDSYATAPNGRSAADTKAAGRDDRTFRDKPFSTVGPISRIGQSGNKSNRGSDHGFRRADGYDPGYLKSKDLCGTPWRVAFALQADGWWLRSDIIWSKPNPMPE
jgi:DNA modification methylase